MKRSVILWMAGMMIGLCGMAQPKNSDFQKLFDLYAMEKYEHCAWKAERYMNKDKYRRDPEPYLYLALCYYQAHVHPELFEVELENPLKDALKYAYKFRKKDKSGELYEANRESLDKIREESLDYAKFLYNDGEYRKSASEFNRILKVIPDDVNVQFITGVAKLMSQNVTEGERLIGQALDTLRVQEEQDRFEKDDVTYEVLIKAFVAYTSYLADHDQLDKAAEVIAFGRKLVPEDLTLKAQYKKIYAKLPD